MFENEYMKPLNENQNYSYIEEMILLILKEQKVSLSQAKNIFYQLVRKIEDDNVIDI